MPLPGTYGYGARDQCPTLWADTVPNTLDSPGWRDNQKMALHQPLDTREACGSQAWEEGQALSWVKEQGWGGGRSPKTQDQACWALVAADPPPFTVCWLKCSESWVGGGSGWCQLPFLHPRRQRLVMWNSTNLGQTGCSQSSRAKDPDTESPSLCLLPRGAPGLSALRDSPPWLPSKVGGAAAWAGASRWAPSLWSRAQAPSGEDLHYP